LLIYDIADVVMPFNLNKINKMLVDNTAQTLPKTNLVQQNKNDINTIKHLIHKHHFPVQSV